MTRRLPALLLLVIASASVAVGPRAQEPSEEAREARADAYAHLMNSTIAARNGDRRKAAEEIQAARKLQPDSASLHAQAAEMLYFIGRVEQAEEAARRAHELEPGLPQALRMLAEMAVQRAEQKRIETGSDDDELLHQALGLLEELDRLGHGDAEVLAAMRAFRARLGDDDGALEAARKLVDLTPGDKHAVSRLIGLLLEARRDDEALATLLDYLSKHPNDGELLAFAQELADRTGGWGAVDERFAEEPGLVRSNTRAQRLWGIALLELDRPEDAVRSFERALVAEPDDEELRFDVAHVYRGVGRLADAASLLRELTAESPSDRNAHLMLGETLAAQGMVDGAQNAFVAALRLLSADGDPESAPARDFVRRRMIGLYLGNEQLEPARQLLRQIENSNEPAMVELAARVAIAAEDWTAAKAAVKRLREAGETSAAALLDGEIQLGTGRHARAEPKFQEAIDGSSPITRVQIAETYLDAGFADEGEAWLRAWVDAEPQNADAVYFLGSYVFRAKGLDEAEPWIRKALELAPDHAPALNFLGYSLADEGRDLDEALAMIRRAVELDPWNGAFLDSLGWAYFRLGDFERAREPLERAAREFPADAVILDHLGDLYRELGEEELARSAWAQALDAEPEDPARIEDKIARLEGGAPEAVENR